MIHWNEQGRVATLKQVEDFEFESGFLIPAPYKYHLMNVANGGQPAEMYVFTISDNEGDTDVSIFYGLNREPVIDLAHILEIFQDDFSSGRFVFGSDSLGNDFFFQPGENGQWAVFFRDHELGSPANLNPVKVADSFDDFLSLCRLDED